MFCRILSTILLWGSFSAYASEHTIPELSLLMAIPLMQQIQNPDDEHNIIEDLGTAGQTVFNAASALWNAADNEDEDEDLNFAHDLTWFLVATRGVCTIQ